MVRVIIDSSMAGKTVREFLEELKCSKYHHIDIEKSIVFIDKGVIAYRDFELRLLEENQVLEVFSLAIGG